MTGEPLKISIRDLGVVATLVTRGFEIEDTYRDPNGQMYFVFQENTSIDKAIKDYYADRIQVKARKYFDNTKMLKARIYNER